MVPLAAQQRLFAGKSVVQLRSCCGVLLPNVLFADKRAPGRMIRVGFDCWLGNAHKSPPRPTCGPWIVDVRKDPAILLLGPNALSASADSNLRSFPSAVEDNVEECDMRAYAFGLASEPCGPNSSVQPRINEQNQLQSRQISDKGDPLRSELCLLGSEQPNTGQGHAVIA
jgi:hypothetical protein